MRALTVVLAIVVVGGCSGSDKPAQGTPAPGSGTGPTTAQDDVTVLGREIFDLVDRAMSYRSSHRGRLPLSLRELGVDELTPTTSRALATTGGIPEVTVAFRNMVGRALASCRGTNTILEEAALSGGEFFVICTVTAGGTTTLKTKR